MWHTFDRRDLELNVEEIAEILNRRHSDQADLQNFDVNGYNCHYWNYYLYVEIPKSHPAFETDGKEFGLNPVATQFSITGMPWSKTRYYFVFRGKFQNIDVLYKYMNEIVAKLGDRDKLSIKITEQKQDKIVMLDEKGSFISPPVSRSPSPYLGSPSSVGSPITHSASPSPSQTPINLSPSGQVKIRPRRFATAVYDWSKLGNIGTI
jgi:hypothetical protein